MPVRARVLCAVLVMMLPGCAVIASPPSPAFTPEAECWRGGGVWHSGMRYCEYNFSELSGGAGS